MDLQPLRDQVARMTNVRAATKTLLETLFAQVEANKTDPAALQDLVDGVRSNLDGMLDDVLVNTPATPVAPA